jgi:diguanylate cyclase (GGDEF)-like protein/PAS domain S-box-containing protein|tara:strand:- start:26091 stop:28241 length:2151 start_codon:yes stop_codon:yes gene_type:complete
MHENKISTEVKELVLDATKVGVWDWSVEKNGLVCNERWAEIIGYSLSELMPIDYQTWIDVLHPDDLPKAIRNFDYHCQGQSDLCELEVRLKHKNGHYVWILSTGKAISWDADGKPTRMIGIHQEIDFRKRQEELLATTTELLKESQRIGKLGGWQFNLNNGELIWTDETYRIYETAPQEFTPTIELVVSYLHSDSKKIFQDAFDAAIKLGKEYDLELETYTTKGQLIDVRTTCNITYSDGVIIKISGIFQDISDEKNNQRKLEKSNQVLKEVNEKLKYAANYDQLTHLPNRNLLADRMQQALIKAQRYNKNIAIAFLDLDGFKEVNDAYGHDIGDEFLCFVANRFKTVIREHDTLARFGGDEFVLILDDLDSHQQARDILQRILSSIAENFVIKNKLLSVTVSIGVTFYPEDDSYADILIRHADQAMYRAKEQGKNCIHEFDFENDVAIKQQYRELEYISKGFNNKEFVLYYQPKINMKTNEIIGLEALIRWQHPTEGLLPPFRFLPYIEGSSMEIELGKWVIDQAIKQLNEWRSIGITIPISVNVSPLQLQHEDFIKQLNEVLFLNNNFQAGQLEFEILESSIIKDTQHIADVINQCKQYGICFSLDDFGTGYSSLSYLRKLRTDAVKIDKSFVIDMLEDMDDQAIVKSIIELSKTFGRSVIAEGVETKEHGEQLLKMGCYKAQGFGIARPMTACAVPAWIQLWNSSPPWICARI